MATVLSLAQSALIRAGESAIPSTLIGNSDPARRAREMMIEEAEYLRGQGIYNQLKKKHTLSVSSTDVSNSRVLYPLPQDYYEMRIGTFWDETNRWQLIGPLSDEEFAYRKQGYSSIENHSAFRIIGPDGSPHTEGGQIELYPTPSAAVTYSFYYIMKTIFVPKLWLPSTAYSLNEKVFINGNIYKCHTAGTSSADDPPSGTGTEIVDNTAKWDYVSEPQEDINLDTDLCLFDNDVIKSGLKWRWEEFKGTKFEKDPITGVPVHHQKIVDAAKGRWESSYKISMSGSNGMNPVPNTPDGGWNL